VRKPGRRFFGRLDIQAARAQFKSMQPTGSTSNLKLVYFAWVRERVGKPEEHIALPASVSTVADLMRWLAARGEEYAYAFENPKVIRAAVDRRHVQPDANIAGAREIAFFPPMTGG
jgi:molybdopterin synthase sulfur carrier subunit